MITASTLTNVLLAVAVVGYVIYKRMSWQELKTQRSWTGPAILALIGVLQMRELGTRPVTAVEIVFLVAGLVLSAVAGLVIATLTQLSWRGDQAYQRLGLAGMAAWVGYLVARVGMGALGHFLGATLTASGGSIMLGIAVNLAVLGFVLANRTGQRLTFERQVG